MALKLTASIKIFRNEMINYPSSNTLGMLFKTLVISFRLKALLQILSNTVLECKFATNRKKNCLCGKLNAE